MKKYKIIKLAILIALITVSAISDDKIRVAIYDDNGCWEDGIIAFESFLNWKEVESNRIDGAAIKAGELANNEYDIIYMPGGMANFYTVGLGNKGINNLRNFVKNGGGYIGICAGAYFASDSIIWEGVKYDYTLDLFDGIAYGSIEEITPWDNHALTRITLTSDNTFEGFQQAQYQTLYYGGPAFYPHDNANVNSFATWDEYNNTNAIIYFNYEEGRVFLAGPHLEIEENSLRDGQAFASELIDEDSEWEILWGVVDWLAKKEISEPPNSIAKERNNSVNCYPNPVSNILSFDISSTNIATIELSIYTLNGTLCKQYSTISNGMGEQEISLNIPDFISGTYFYTLKIGNQITNGKFIYKK